MSRYSLAVGMARAEEIALLARQAEDAGVEALWAAGMSRGPFLPLAAAATSTERIQLGTSIALAFVRSPWVTALSALDMDILSGGRFILGLGTGLKRLNERWHGVAYGKPTPHIKECIQVVRLITENAHLGLPIRFSGQYYDLDIQGWQRPFPPQRARIPVFLAGGREGMIRTGGGVADRGGGAGGGGPGAERVPPLPDRLLRRRQGPDRGAKGGRRDDRVLCDGQHLRAAVRRLRGGVPAGPGGG